ncbi:MAG: DUF488 domain-containing protein [Burkholderiales bacterium]|nr:DUF488 domain-containing protein [Burkholderiales bacterium]
MAIRNLYTIGYEGSDLDSFIEALAHLGITTVLDIRELPLSRKRGFSKTPLSGALAEVGIGYRHERALGCPPEIRNRLRHDGDYRRYFEAFNRYLLTQLDVVEHLVAELDGSVALLCYERDPAYCHRRSVAEQMRELFALIPRHVAVPA